MSLWIKWRLNQSIVVSNDGGRKISENHLILRKNRMEIVDDVP